MEGRSGYKHKIHKINSEQKNKDQKHNISEIGRSRGFVGTSHCIHGICFLGGGGGGWQSFTKFYGIMPVSTGI